MTDGVRFYTSPVQTVSKRLFCEFFCRGKFQLFSLNNSPSIQFVNQSGWGIFHRSCKWSVDVSSATMPPLFPAFTACCASLKSKLLSLPNGFPPDSLKCPLPPPPLYKKEFVVEGADGQDRFIKQAPQYFFHARYFPHKFFLFLWATWDEEERVVPWRPKRLCPGPSCEVATSWNSQTTNQNYQNNQINNNNQSSLFNISVFFGMFAIE